MAAQGGHRGYVWDGRKWRHIVGLPGKDGQSINVKGAVADATALPVTGMDGDSYVTQDTGNLHVWTGKAWLDVGPFQGPAGAQGTAGLKGDPGRTLAPNGVVADYASLPDFTVVTPPPGLPTYVTQDTTTMYVYEPTSAAADANGWVDMGKVQGPPGAPVVLRGAVADAAALPTTGNRDGDARITLDDGHIHSWDEANGAWTDGGKIVGSAGTAGTASGLSIWSDGDYPTGTVVIHNGSLWFAHIPAYTGDEPGVVPTGGAVTGTWTMAAASTSSMHTIANPQGGSPTVELYDFLHSQKAANSGYFLQTPNQQPYTPATGAFAGHTFNDMDLLIYTGSPNAGTLGWIVVPQSSWQPTGSYAWSAPVSSSWQQLGGASASPALDDLSDVDAAAPTVFDTLMFVNGTWVAHQPITQAFTISEADDTAIANVSADDVLTYDYTTFKWVNRQPTPPRLQSLANVTATLPLDGAVPRYVQLADEFEWADDLVTQAILNAAIDAIASGLSHQQAVDEIVSTPDPNVPDGHIVIVGLNATGAFATHENEVAQHLAGHWTFTAPHRGDSHFNEADKQTYTWNGTAWVVTASSVSSGGGTGLPVGSILQSVLSETEFANAYPSDAGKWLPCDGRTCVNTRYAQITGSNTVPDLRGAYLRMAGQSARDASWHGGGLRSFFNWMTGQARNPFTVQAGGSHNHPIHAATGRSFTSALSGSPEAFAAENNVFIQGIIRDTSKRNMITEDGLHTHSLPGGDAETRPNTYAVTFFVRVQD